MQNGAETTFIHVLTMSTQQGTIVLKKINQSKSQKIKKERGASIEEVVTSGELLSVRKNPQYENQWLEIYNYENYVWIVVTGSEPDRYITMYKSRKLKKEFGI